MFSREEWDKACLQRLGKQRGLLIVWEFQSMAKTLARMGVCVLG